MCRLSDLWLTAAMHVAIVLVLSLLEEGGLKLHMIVLYSITESTPMVVLRRYLVALRLNKILLLIERVLLPVAGFRRSRLLILATTRPNRIMFTHLIVVNLRG